MERMKPIFYRERTYVKQRMYDGYPKVKDWNDKELNKQRIANS